MKKKERKGPLVFLLLILSLLLIGCTPDTIYIDRNNTIIIYNSTHINRTINNTIPCNITGPEINTSFDRSYLLSLIRRVKFLEGRQDRYWNNSECYWELNQSNVKLDKAEKELCEWNSSWC